jgi:MerR family transcriptional regulator, light-induced transcriptional regulator
MDAHHQFKIDADLYARTSNLFEAKRSALAPDAVERLAREVVERLAAARRGDPDVLVAPALPAPDRRMVNAFCDVLLAPDPTAPLRFLEQDLAPLVAERTALYSYISAASRRLGEMWDADQVTFVDVTLSVGKLYALVRAIGSNRTRPPIADHPRKYALFASVPGEQHTMGVAIAAELFRDAGWDIDLQVGATHDELLVRAERMQPVVAGLSLSGVAGLDALARLVVSLRLTLPDIVIAVAGGADIESETLRNLVDLDLVITDAKQAQSDLDRLVRRPGAA